MKSQQHFSNPAQISSHGHILQVPGVGGLEVLELAAVRRRDGRGGGLRGLARRRGRAPLLRGLAERNDLIPSQRGD